MKPIKLLSIIACLFAIGQAKMHAQETVSASGGNATGNNGSMSYTAGQVFCSTLTAANSTLTEGVQQPHEIFRVTSSQAFVKSSLTVLAYPNPTTDKLLLEIENPIQKDLRYQIYNDQGQLLASYSIRSSDILISMENYIPAIYFLKIFQNQQEIISFKIVKQ